MWISRFSRLDLEESGIRPILSKIRVGDDRRAGQEPARLGAELAGHGGGDDDEGVRLEPVGHAQPDACARDSRGDATQNDGDVASGAGQEGARLAS